ncbi:hypothetical protein ABZT17_18050 [Streptomyces sp. NPDC005648]|uniref:hypothetical protein n=1 Tax=Streptomyces sp. NPDC005648 TaxID=3157044 RepID=UPI0033A948E0
MTATTRPAHAATRPACATTRPARATTRPARATTRRPACAASRPACTATRPARATSCPAHAALTSSPHRLTSSPHRPRASTRAPERIALSDQLRCEGSLLGDECCEPGAPGGVFGREAGGWADEAVRRVHPRRPAPRGDVPPAALAHRQQTAAPNTTCSTSGVRR